jgi:hypothetical protein
MPRVLHKDICDLSYFQPPTLKKEQQYYSSKILVPYSPTRISLFHGAVYNVITFFFCSYAKEKDTKKFNSHNLILIITKRLH